MATKIEWKATDVAKASYVGVLEIEGGDSFEILSTEKRLVFGGACNAGFLESGYMELYDDESVDAALRELLEELEVYYRDGPTYTSRIVFNERM